MLARGRAAPPARPRPPPRQRARPAPRPPAAPAAPAPRPAVAHAAPAPAPAAAEMEAGGLRRSGRARTANVTLLQSRNERDKAAGVLPQGTWGRPSDLRSRAAPKHAKRTVAGSAPRAPEKVLEWAVKELGELTGALGAPDAAAAPPEFLVPANEDTLRKASLRMRQRVEAGVWDKLCAVCGQYRRKADMTPEGAS